MLILESYPASIPQQHEERPTNRRTSEQDRSHLVCPTQSQDTIPSTSCVGDPLSCTCSGALVRRGDYSPPAWNEMERVRLFRCALSGRRFYVHGRVLTKVLGASRQTPTTLHSIYTRARKNSPDVHQRRRKQIQERYRWTPALSLCATGSSPADHNHSADAVVVKKQAETRNPWITPGVLTKGILGYVYWLQILSSYLWVSWTYGVNLLQIDPFGSAETHH